MIIIGEKINGFIPKTGAAIKEGNADYIKELAVKQTEAGAHYLDCCPATSEGALETMKWLVDNVQEACDTKICLDSPDADILIEAMDYCNKPGMINSVSVGGDKISRIFPLIKGTPWKCVVMLDDEKGIPRTAAERVEVFKRLLVKIEEYGVSPDQIYVDPLVESISTADDRVLIFTDTCREIKKLCPQIHITSGLSNISYGMPARKIINMAFMVLAMQAGMDSVIVDPLNRDMMGLIFATEALLGEDEYCMEYITAYREGIFGNAAK